MKNGHEVPAFASYVQASRDELTRIAFLMTNDWHAAEDLVQDVLARAYVRWSRICREGDPEPYVRQSVIHAAVDQKRRAWRRRERSVEQVPDELRWPASMDPGSIHEHNVLREALSALPAGQRAVVVLRYVEDWSIGEVAHCLGLAEGTVKSQAARGLAALRQRLSTDSQIEC